MKLHLLVFLFLFSAVPLFLFGQQKAILVHRSINWDNEPRKYTTANGQIVQYYSFEGASYSYQTNYLPIYGEQLAAKKNTEALVSISNEHYEPLLNELVKDKSKLFSTVRINSKTVEASKNYFLQIEFVPIRLNPLNQQLEKLVDFDLQVVWKTNTTAIPAKNKSYAAHSVLATGNWIKLAVNQNGMYKLDKTYLASIGFPVSSIDPMNIRIYSNGGGMVPQLNDVQRYDDLHENPVVVVGENDHHFDDGDYVLFYGEGPDKVFFNTATSKYQHEKNLYSNVACYFITADLGAGKRITPEASLSTFNITSTKCDQFVYRDLDEVNLTMSGRQWFEKENFANIKQRTYTFPSANRNTTSPIIFTLSTAGKHTSASYLTATINGQSAQTHSYAAVYDGYENDYADAVFQSTSANYAGGSLTVDLNYSASSGNAWLDYIELQTRCDLTMSGDQFSFSDIQTIGISNKTQFQLQNGVGSLVWDITNPVEPKLQLGQNNGTYFQFNANSDILHEYIAFNGNSFLTPVSAITITNQDLHAKINEFPQLLIVTHPDFMTAANNLKAFHEKLGQSTLVVDENLIYNEFGSGKQDIAAIRDFVKLFYDEAGSDVTKTPKYLLLVGDGSYDNRNITTGNSAFIPTYQSLSSVETIYSYGTDDFYGMLSAGEGGDMESGFQLLDIAIGRLPVKTISEANEVVAKIEHYQNASFGSWRNTITFVADDENQNLHLNQSDGYAENLRLNQPNFNIDKIYLDAYKQEESAGGARYPAAHDAIIRRIESGSAIVNYTGHGGESGWCHERVFQSDDINALTNFEKLSIFITATCQFSRYDRPDMVTAGEDLLLNPKGGAIALLTTVRLVYSSDNQAMNTAVYKNYFNKNSEGRHYTFGEVTQLAKNDGSVGKSENNRKFTLLGDPALPLPFSTYTVKNTFINNQAIALKIDTLKALKKVTVKGELVDTLGNKLVHFNGIVYPTLFDKPVQIATLANDPAPKFPDGSFVRNFNLQKNAIYRGKASVVNGDFSYTFIVPKDIAYNYGNGKFSYYADNQLLDGSGYDNTIVIGGISNEVTTDKKGPSIKLYMNNMQFVNGGITDQNPTLIVNLYDESGINTLGTGIGHDIVAVLDEDTKNEQTLNDFYEAALDEYQRGSIQLPYAKLKAGKHSMRVKAWDVYNNSAETTINFEVVDQNSIQVSHVYNYPNPFVNKTQFMFDHNQADQNLSLTIKIFTISGKLVKTIRQDVQTTGYHVDGIYWDGTDDYNDKLARGIYFYSLTTKGSKGRSTVQMQKLVIL